MRCFVRNVCSFHLQLDLFSENFTIFSVSETMNLSLLLCFLINFFLHCSLPNIFEEKPVVVKPQETPQPTLVY